MLADTSLFQHDLVSHSTAISKDALLRHIRLTFSPNKPTIRWLTISKDCLGNSGQKAALLEPLSQLYGTKPSRHKKRHILPIHDSHEAPCAHAAAAGGALQQAPSDADVCSEGFDVGVRLSNKSSSTTSAAGCCAMCQRQPTSDVPGCTASAAAGPNCRQPTVMAIGTCLRRLSASTNWFPAMLKPISSLKLPAADGTRARLAAATSTSSSLQPHALSMKLLPMGSKSSKFAVHKDTATHALRCGSGKRTLQRRQRRTTSVFEATGREDIRHLLGPHAMWGSITRFKMLLLAERVHEADLQHVLSQSTHQVDWAGTPAWEDDFSGLNKRYGQRVQQHLFWWGGALTRQRDTDDCHDSSSA